MHNKSRVRKRNFIIMMIFNTVYLIISIFLSKGWYLDLTFRMKPIFAIYIILTLALIPGWMLTTLIINTVLRRDNDYTKPLPCNLDSKLPDITVLIAAYNEEESVYNTIKSLYNQTFHKNLIVKVVDNNSSDNTAKEIARAKRDFRRQGFKVEYYYEPRAGKAAALNSILPTVESENCMTVDADAELHPDCIIILARHLYYENFLSNGEVAGVAGKILVNNPHKNIITRIQDIEYWLSLNLIKASQAVYHSTLVLQGLSSLFIYENLCSVGGFDESSIIEDGSLSIENLKDGFKTDYESRAITWTDVPNTLKSMAVQKGRWSRGIPLFFKETICNLPKNRYAIYFLLMNAFMPFIDFSTVFILFPSIIKAIFLQDYLIAGPMLLILFPLTIVLFSLFAFYQYKNIFQPMNIDFPLKNNILGFIVFLLCFHFILAPMSLTGYLQEIFGAKHKWR